MTRATETQDYVLYITQSKDDEKFCRDIVQRMTFTELWQSNDSTIVGGLKVWKPGRWWLGEPPIKDYHRNQNKHERTNKKGTS